MNALAIALDSIWSHRVRSALTALGIVIGVFAVVTLTSLGTGVRNYVSRQFSSLGATTITVTSAIPSATGKASAKPAHGAFPGVAGAVPSTLTLNDVASIQALKHSGIAHAAPVVTLPLPVSATRQGSAGAPVIGTAASYFSIEGLHFSRGAFASDGVVLGHDAAATLFPGVRNPVGRTVYLGPNQTLQVTGVLDAGQGLLGKQADPEVFVPAAQGLQMAGLNKISEIVVQATGNDQVNLASNAVTRVLTKHHPLRDFSVIKDSQMLATINNTLATITTFLGGLAAVSLLVGGIGIMNIMLVTVTERFREIGIRKAMGARDRDVLVQFLAESILLALIGGAIGVGFAAVASQFIGHLAGFSAGITWGSVALAAGFSIAVGAVFGVLPAFRASRLMPAATLRTE